ncbi:MAG: ThuA domain-containing protein, partial [Planctomycetes bacterium]|nr:ThuA domain-containing protein [Planctomycetota bacterium]
MHRRLLPALFLCLLSVVGLARGSEAPLRLFLRGGPKTHGPGEHEHEKWLTEWSALLRARGAVVEGALRHPTPEELERCDVLVVYAAEAGTVRGEDRAALESFLERGGGIAVLHDGVCGEEPGWYQTVIGGAWEHGHSKWLIEKQGLYVVDDDHPIVRGVANYDLADEIYYDLHMDSQARVLMSSFRTPFDVEPQMWTLERGKGRAFVNIQGHYWTTFSHPSFRALTLRGIAWAGGRDVDTFLTPEEVQALRYPPGGPTAPERAHESMVLHPDFELSLVAAEPLVVNPISLDWDARGRLWVACTPGYPYKQEFSGVPAHDEVLVLRDEDGDGRMDASTVFADGLDLVTSLVLHEDGVIVSQAPELLWLRDTDGDGRCDTREVLFSGFGYGDTHAVISNLRWGRDGWVYGTQGYSGNASRHVTNAAGRDFGHVGNGLFRFKPDGSAIEVVSSYGSNTWGCDFDREGELFYTMANGSHLRHVVLPERVLGGGRVGGVNSWTHVPDHREAHAILDESRTVYQQIDFVGGFTAAA